MKTAWVFEVTVSADQGIGGQTGSRYRLPSVIPQPKGYRLSGIAYLSVIPANQPHFDKKLSGMREYRWIGVPDKRESTVQAGHEAYFQHDFHSAHRHTVTWLTRSHDNDTVTCSFALRGRKRPQYVRVRRRSLATMDSPFRSSEVHEIPSSLPFFSRHSISYYY